MNTEPKSNVLAEIEAERNKQIAKGFDASHDDTHDRGEIAFAAIAFALASANQSIGMDAKNVQSHLQMMHWPADWGTFKMAESLRENLVKSAALIVAEIERIDRNALATPGAESGVAK